MQNFTGYPKIVSNVPSYISFAFLDPIAYFFYFCFWVWHIA